MPPGLGCVGARLQAHPHTLVTYPPSATARPLAADPGGSYSGHGHRDAIQQCGCDDCADSISKRCGWYKQMRRLSLRSAMTAWCRRPSHAGGAGLGQASLSPSAAHCVELVLLGHPLRSAATIAPEGVHLTCCWCSAMPSRPRRLRPALGALSNTGGSSARL